MAYKTIGSETNTKDIKTQKQWNGLQILVLGRGIYFRFAKKIFLSKKYWYPWIEICRISYVFYLYLNQGFI